jgi:cell wall assembly regulator SMI1
MTFEAYLKKLKLLYAQQERSLVLQRGASATALQQVEKKLGSKLDPGLKAAWKCANGNSTSDYNVVFARHGFLTGYQFLSTKKALAERAGMQRRAPQYSGYVEETKRDTRIQDQWFAPGWLPFASFGGATLLLIQDHSPTKKGKVGQIIAFTHDPDEISYVAKDFATFLKLSMRAIAADPLESLAE